MQAKSLANLLSFLRLISTFIFCFFFIKRDWWAAFFVFLFGAISDVYDGKLARVKKEKSITGEVLDPIADKFLVISALFLIWQEKSLPLPTWCFFTILIREVGISLIRLNKLVVGEKRYLCSFSLGKIKTATQMISILFGLFLLATGLLNLATYLYYLFILATLLTLISGFEYIFKVRTSPEVIKITK